MATDVSAIPLGTRVVVRSLLDPPGEGVKPGPSMTDTVGHLSAVDERSVVVETSRGAVTVRRDRIVAVKEVPPKPTRRAAPHLALSAADMQRVVAPSWGAAERAELGDWQLRASGGFSHRGNSVLAVGSPGIPLAEAVAQVEQWYAVRGLPAMVALAGPVGFDPADDPLGALLLARGYSRDVTVLTLTAAAAQVAATDRPGPLVVTSAELGSVWLEAYRRIRPTVPGFTEAVLTGSPRQLFAHIAPGGGLSQQLGLRAADAAGTVPIALARLGFGAGWAGLGAVWTDPAYRGRGLAAHLTARLATQAQADGTALLHLQVEQGNAAALRLYHRLGFATHSAYAYLTSQWET